MLQVASSQDVQRIYLSIHMDPTTSADYAGQFSSWSLTNPVLYSVGFDDLVNRMEHLQTDYGVAVPGTVITDTLNASKSANPNLKFHVTMYEDQLSSPLLGDSNLPPSTRSAVDYVQLYVHYRADGPNFPSYIQQTKTIFPNAKIIAGAYAYDRIDYLPCLPKGSPCTTQQEENYFQQLFLLQLSELQQGTVDQIEYFPGYFGIEAQWSGWNEARRCAPTRLQDCIANTLAMRQMVEQDLASTFGSPGPLTSLSPRPLIFPVQNVSTTSGASTIELNNPGTAPLNISSIAITGDNASEFTQKNSCPATLVAGANCSIDITFTPAAVGTRASHLVVTDNARRSPHSMDVSGVGANSSSPQVLLTPTALNFQDQTIGTTSPPSSILLSNPGGSELSISSISISGSSSSQFAQTNNCGTSVASSANCAISVTFTPSAVDNQSAQLVITDDAVGSPHIIPLTGIGSAVVAPQVLLSATVLSFASQQVGTTSSAQSVSLSNPGNASLAISGIFLSGTNMSEFSQTNDCGTSLAAGKNCTLSIAFVPSASGPRTAQLLIADSANGSPQSVTLNGTGEAPPSPVATLSANMLTFSSQTVNTHSAPLPVTLTNTGNASLTLSGFSIGGANASDFSQTNTCGSSLSVAATCTVSIIFIPSAAGARTAQLRIADNATGTPQIVNLSGTGAVPLVPALTVSPTVITFPSQTINTSSASMSISLSNTGNASLTLTSVTTIGANASDFTDTSTCGSNVPAAGTCALTVTFKPSTTGARTAQLQIIDNAAGSPQTITLNGTGAATVLPTATLAPASITFASQTINSTSNSQAVLLNNTSNVPLTITSIAISGSNAADFSQTNACGSSLAPASTCSINLSFTPIATGTRSAQLQVVDNAAGSPQSVSLAGTGAALPAPALALTPAQLNFGNQSMGVTSPPAAVTISNTGNAGLAIRSVVLSGANATDFTETNNCSTTILAGANCAISVLFTPAASGARYAQVVVTDNASGSPHMVSLSGTGVSVTPSDFALSAMPQSAALSSGQSAIFTLSVTPSGGFNQSVAFTCSGLPAGAACNFAPASVTPGASSAAATTLTITTTLRSAAIFRMPLSYLRYRTVESFLLVCSLLYICICAAKKAHQIRPRAVLTPWLASSLTILLFSLMGCSSTSSVSPVQTPGLGTPAGNYSVSVTASSGNLTHQLALSLTVK